MEEIIKNIFCTFIGGVLGYLARLYLEHRLALDRIKEEIRITAKNRAIGEFRAAFAPAIVKFKITRDPREVETMLYAELINQGIAIERFRPYVKDEKAYQEAWENYHLSHKRENGVSSVYFLDYTMGEEHKRFQLFNERISAILDFAKSYLKP